MLVDRGFKCEKKIKPGAYYGVLVKNLQRSLVLKFRNSQSQTEWLNKLNQLTVELDGKYLGAIPNESFAPVRHNQMCKWFINAELYMENVMHGLNNAKEEIFITDWWLCPEIYLKRPSVDLQFRLDKVLLKKAHEGVKVYILLFKELEFALGLLSSRAQSVLTQDGKNPNIKIIRHPTTMTMWSHHEKCVIIDQSIAFMGGIDLCFGRWDDDLHR